MISYLRVIDTSEIIILRRFPEHIQYSVQLFITRSITRKMLLTHLKHNIVRFKISQCLTHHLIRRHFMVGLYMYKCIAFVEFRSVCQDLSYKYNTT